MTRSILHRKGYLVAVSVNNGEMYPPVFIESLIAGGPSTATRWCEVLGEPGVNRDARAAFMVDALAQGLGIEPTP